MSGFCFPGHFWLSGLIFKWLFGKRSATGRYVNERTNFGSVSSVMLSAVNSRSGRARTAVMKSKPISPLVSRQSDATMSG